MFSIHTIQQSGFDVIVLKDSSNGTQAEIIPAHSALLHAFKIPYQGAFLNIIDSYSDLEDYKAHLPEFYKSAKLSPFAGRIPDREYRWQEQPYRISKSLQPANAIHGLLYDAAFSVTGRQADEQGARLTLLHRYAGNDPGYPFPFDCEVQYSLLPGQRLEISTLVTNRADTAIPLMDGWHPYFTTGTPVDELELQFASKEIVEFSEQLVPTGRVLPFHDFEHPVSLSGKSLDNSFMLDFSQPAPLCTLRDPQKRIVITLFPDAAYPVLQVYIPPHRRSIAIENQTGAPNAFNNGMGLITLPAAESRRFTTAIAAGAY